MKPKPTDETHVLIVEDEPRLREVLVSGIRELGFPARGVRSGEDAIHLMERETHDILLVDLNLPGIDGLETIEQVRAHWPRTSFIILTGYGNLEAAQQAIRLDVSDFLTKPASLGELEQALHRAWSERASLPPADVDSRPQLSVPPQTPQTLEEIEKNQIRAAIDRHNGNRATAAAELGISVRTLYYKLAAMGRADSDHDSEMT